MAFIRRTRWNVSEAHATTNPKLCKHVTSLPHSPHAQVLVGMLVLLMFCLNVVFIVDLTVNHRAHSNIHFTLMVLALLSIICPLSTGHLITALQDRGPGEVTGEKSMKQFINLRVKSSKTAVEVHIGHDLVKQLVLKKLISKYNGSSFFSLRSIAATHKNREEFTLLYSMRPL